MAGLQPKKNRIAATLQSMGAGMFGTPPVAPDLTAPLPLPQEPVYDDLNPYPDPPNSTIPTPAANENDSVESRLSGLLSGDSDYIKQARAAGTATANRRGLLNTSMAAGAAQGAAIERALPIATADAQIAASKNLQSTDIVAQRERLQISNDAEMNRLQRQLENANEQQRKDIEAQMARLSETNAAEMARLERQGTIQGGLAEQQFGHQTQLSAQEQTAVLTRQREMVASEELRLGRQLTAAEQQQARDLASREVMQQREFGQQTGTIQYQAQQEMARLQASTAAEMTRLQAQLQGADTQQQREIGAQMERLRVSTDAEMARLSQAAGYDMERLNREGQINIARDAAQATNAQDLARVQGSIQSAMQAQGNTEQIQRMGVDLANQLQVQGATFENDLRKISASGDQDIRRLVEAANQERVTLQQSIAAQDREKMASAMVNIFQVEAQMRAALLGNTTIPASERASYERAITSLGDPIRNYVNQLFGSPASPSPAPVPGGMIPTPEGTPGSPIIDGGYSPPGGLLETGLIDQAVLDAADERRKLGML